MLIAVRLILIYCIASGGSTCSITWVWNILHYFAFKKMLIDVHASYVSIFSVSFVKYSFFCFFGGVAHHFYFETV